MLLHPTILNCSTISKIMKEAEPDYMLKSLFVEKDASPVATDRAERESTMYKTMMVVQRLSQPMVCQFR